MEHPPAARYFAHAGSDPFVFSEVTGVFPDPTPSALQAPRPWSPPDPRAEPSAPPAVPGRVPDLAPWPSAQAILAAHRAAHGQPSSPSPRAAVRSKPVPRPMPTVAQEPATWRIAPVLWVWVPMTAFILFLGMGGLMLAWGWGQDEQAIGPIADRLLKAGKPATPEELDLIAKLPAASTAWWRTTSGHLLLRAVAWDRSKTAPEGGRAETVRGLLHAARHAAPLQPSVRLAWAQLAPGGAEAPAPAASLALSHDIVSRARTGRALLEAGRTATALGLYRDALELACRVEPEQLPIPRFDDDPEVRRFLLPEETLIRPIVRELAEHPGWTYAEWSDAIPPDAVARLAAARVLLGLERTSEAEAALDQVLAAAEHPAGSGPARAVTLAAAGEALALRGQWGAARRPYQQAIGLMPVERVRRTWWINLAELASRDGEESAARAAWDAARGPNPYDELGQLAEAAQRRAGMTAAADPLAAASAPLRTRAAGPSPTLEPELTGRDRQVP